MNLNQSTLNTIFNIIDVIFLPLAMIIATPIFINYLGIDGYGKWMLINSLLIVMSVLNIGGGDTLIRYVSIYRMDNNKQGVREVFSTVACLQIILFSFFLILSLFVPFFISSNNFLSDNVDFEFSTAIKFGVLIFSIKILEQVFLSYFKAYERYDISALLSILSKLSIIAIQLYTVINGEGLDRVFQNSFYMLGPIVILQFVAIKLHNPNIKLFQNFRLERVKEIFAFTKWSWLTSMVTTFGGQVDRWIVAGLTDMKVLGIYSLVLLVFNNIHFVTSSSVSWIFPKAAKQSDNNVLLNYYLKLQGVILLISIFISSFLYTFDNIFLLWLGERTYLDSIEYIKILLLFLPLYSLSIVPYYLLKAKGFIKCNFNADFGSLFIKSILIFILFKLYSVEGVIFAIGVSGILLTVYLSHRLVYLVFNERQSNILYAIIIPFSYIGLMLIDLLYVKFFFVFIMFFSFKSVFYKSVYNFIRYRKL